MKLSIARSELLDALSVVSRGMSSRSTLPILSGIYMSAAGGQLTLQSTDLEVSIKHNAPALVEQEGASVVPGKLLADIVRSLPEAAVTLDFEKDMAHIRCQQSAFTVRTLNPTDFPKFPELSIDRSMEIPSDALITMVRRVSKAVSRDETRAVLTGVLFVIEGATVKMVATDSYRLAIAQVAMDTPIGEDIEAVIPGRALDEVSKLASSAEKLTLGLSENQVVFQLGETTFVTRRIEGTFPNYRQLIPKEQGTRAELSTEEFFAAVKRVSLMALHNTPLRISIQSEDQTVSLSATTQDVGDASEDLMSKTEGPDVEIAFNHAFLIDGLSSVTADTLRLDVQSALKPGLIRSGEGDEFTYLLMPVRLG